MGHCAVDIQPIRGFRWLVYQSELYNGLWGSQATGCRQASPTMTIDSCTETTYLCWSSLAISSLASNTKFFAPQVFKIVSTMCSALCRLDPFCSQITTALVLTTPAPASPDSYSGFGCPCNNSANRRRTLRPPAGKRPHLLDSNGSTPHRESVTALQSVTQFRSSNREQLCTYHEKKHGQWSRRVMSNDKRV